MEQLHWVIRKIIRETPQASSFVLRLTEGGDIHYEAGQFLTFLFPVNGHDLRRSYSLSSAPGIDPDPVITVKRKVNGEISRRWLDEMKPGDRLISLPPAGLFTCETNPDQGRQLFFVAAGSGIGPVFSLIKKAIAEEPLSKLVLIDQNHAEEDIIFRQALAGMVKSYPQRFRWISLLSHPPDRHHPSRRLNNDLLRSLVSENRDPDKECQFFLCGPEAFMRMAEFTLRAMGIAENKIRKEHFTIGFIPPPPLNLDRRPWRVTLDFNHQQLSFDTQFPSNILQSALDHGILLPYSCRGGRCSTCMAKCIEGRVHMSINEVLTDEDISAGWVLTCVGYAASDVHLQFNS